MLVKLKSIANPNLKTIIFKSITTTPKSLPRLPPTSNVRLVEKNLSQHLRVVSNQVYSQLRLQSQPQKKGQLK